jgi:hypothetical protein
MQISVRSRRSPASRQSWLPFLAQTSERNKGKKKGTSTRCMILEVRQESQTPISASSYLLNFGGLGLFPFDRNPPFGPFHRSSPWSFERLFRSRDVSLCWQSWCCRWQLQDKVGSTDQGELRLPPHINPRVFVPELSRATLRCTKYASRSHRPRILHYSGSSKPPRHPSLALSQSPSIAHIFLCGMLHQKLAQLCCRLMCRLSRRTAAITEQSYILWEREGESTSCDRRRPSPLGQVLYGCRMR